TLASIGLCRLAPTPAFSGIADTTELARGPTRSRLTHNGGPRANSQLALVGVPVLLQIDNELIAQMAESLFEGVSRHIPAEGFQRLGLLADRLAVSAGADDARSDRVFDAARDRLVHFA